MPRVTLRLEGHRVELWEVLTIIDVFIASEDERRVCGDLTIAERTDAELKYRGFNELRDFMLKKEWDTME